MKLRAEQGICAPCQNFAMIRHQSFIIFSLTPVGLIKQKVAIMLPIGKIIQNQNMLCPCTSLRFIPGV